MNVPTFGSVRRLEQDCAPIVYNGESKINDLRKTATDSSFSPEQTKFNTAVVDYLSLLGEATRASLAAHRMHDLNIAGLRGKS